MREATADIGERRVAQRRYAPKTRTGCMTCKIRRVKCDEAKPSCNRCTSTGRKCDGYALPQNVPDHNDTRALTAALSFDEPWSCEGLEKRTFDFFRSNTAPFVSGYFTDSVWDRYVLQMSHSEPTVRHAVNALGALHEERQLRRTASESGLDVSAVKTSFPAVQYTKALRGLQLLLCNGSPPIDLVLMCVLLLVHFEALRESFIPALVHMEHAIRLLQSQTAREARKVDSSLIRSVMRLDVQGSMYLGGRIPLMPFYTSATDSVLPTTFHDLTHARDIINTWTCRLFHFMRVEGDIYRRLGGLRDIPLEAIARSHELVQTFVDLDLLLWKFMHKPTVKLSLREQHGLGMLRSRVKMNRICSAVYPYTEATMFDAFTQEFEDILTICMHIMGSDQADQRLLCVSLDEGLIQPLWFTAVNCRESRIRHQALAQLQKLPVAGGTWHVEAMTRTAQICVKFEEAHCGKELPSCHDIPEWRRILAAGFDGWTLQVPRHKVNAHMRIRPNGMDGECVELSESIQLPMPQGSCLRTDEADALVLDNALMRHNLHFEYMQEPGSTRVPTPIYQVSQYI